MAKRLLMPLMGLGLLVTFCWNASLRLCAGSVLMMSTFFLLSAICIATLQDVVVLPTPPFPPTNIHFSELSTSF